MALCDNTKIHWKAIALKGLYKHLIAMELYDNTRVHGKVIALNTLYKHLIANSSVQ